MQNINNIGSIHTFEGYNTCEELDRSNSSAVNLFDINEFYAIISPKGLSDEKKIAQLKEQLSHVRATENMALIPEWWQCFVEVDTAPNNDPFYLTVLFFQGDYDTNALTQRAIETGFENHQKYYYIKLFDSRDLSMSKPCLQLRFDPNFANGELIHIESIPGQLSGTEMKNKFLDPLLNYLNVKSFYLNDEATLHIKDSHSRIHELSIRLLKLGESWYGENGFLPAECNQWQTPSGIHITQKRKNYYAAVEHIQSTRLRDMMAFLLIENPKKHHKFSSIASSYLDNRSLENSKLSTLVDKISDKMRDSSSKTVQKKAMTDMTFVFEACLAEKPVGNGSTSCKQALYQKAINIIHATKIWVKADIDDPFHSDFFERMPHQKFETLVKNGEI